LHILHVVGARPNFMKVAPVIAALSFKSGITQTLVHTGQHYDHNMSQVFFRQLDIPEPDINLEVGSASHAVQTAQIMLRFEEVVQTRKPDWVLVYGDVNSTIAAALVCAKLWIPVAHVEAGLRSGDRRMPEEINRLMTDQLASLLFTPSTDGDENLKREGVTENRIRFVGNVMIDTLIRLLPRAEQAQLPPVPARYALVTLHRPSNVDDPTMLQQIIETLTRISEHLPILFPIHPRTLKRLAEYSITISPDRQFQLLEPVGYIEFLALQRKAVVVITDSGGIQEETSYLGVPCLTMRENTERPITVTMGTNVLVGQDMERLETEVRNVLNGHAKPGHVPPLWDGKASERIAEIMLEHA
jgi:UDP-N-acetylglucosamine 2-epimerase (non-hydrolysing)